MELLHAKHGQNTILIGFANYRKVSKVAFLLGFLFRKDMTLEGMFPFNLT